MATCPELRVIEFYSGVGGWHHALRETGLNITVQVAVDINTTANEVYRHNFPLTKLLQRNICGLTSKELDSYAADIFTISPPCQPFTRQGKMKDSLDHRTDSFFHLMSIIKTMIKLPKYIMMENVKGFETSQTRDHFKELLSSLGYNVQEFLLSPKQFRVPNSRLRYYLLARFQPFDNNDFISPCQGMEFLEQYIPTSFKLRPTIESYLDSNERDFRPFLLSDKTLLSYAMCLDIVCSSSLSCCCFTRGYYHYSVGTGSVLQQNSTADLDLAYQLYRERKATGDIKGCIEPLKELQLRYFTPDEVANLMCFPVTHSFPDCTTVGQRYRLVGNSVNVLVVSTLLCYLCSIR